MLTKPCTLFCFFLLLINLSHAQTFKPALQPVINNYTSFSTGNKRVTMQGSKNYPVIGSTQSADIDSYADEVIEKRTLTSKYYVDKHDRKKFYQLFSYGGNLHYIKNGKMFTVNQKLGYAGLGLYEASNQQHPVGFNVNNKTAFIKTAAGQVNFNNWTLTGEKGGTSKLLAHADWSHFTAGDDGIRVHNIFPGIDAEMNVLRGAIKTNFIVRKDRYPNIDKFIFNDHFNTGQRGGKLVYTGNNKDHHKAAFLLNNKTCLNINRAVAYTEKEASKNYLYLDYEINNNDLSFGIEASYIDKNLRSGSVIIDPLVLTTDTVAQSLITGSMNCGSYTNYCNYNFTVATPAQATFTDISFMFTFYAFAPSGQNQGFFSINSGSCSSGNYTVVDPSIHTGPGSVGSLGNFQDMPSVLNCLPPPSCLPQNVPFQFHFWNTYCGADTACSDTYVAAFAPLIIRIEGRTLEFNTITAPLTICNGSATTLQASGIYGVPPYTYLWNNNATTSSITVSPAATTNYSVVITDQCGNTASGGTSVNVNPVPAVQSASSNSPVCAGSPLNLSTPTVTGATYSWTGPGGFTSTGNNPSIPAATIAQSGNYSVTITVNGCTSPPVSTSVVIDTPATPVVNILASATTVCAGSVVNFTAVPINGGAAPVYQWAVNGSNAGTNSSTLRSDNLNNGDTVTCVLTTSLSCVTAGTATSNSIRMTVNPVVVASVTITADTTSVCAGTPVTFTAKAVNAGSNPGYQWLVNGNRVGSNSATYTENNPNDGDLVVCAVTNNGVCTTTPGEFSNYILLKVSPVVTPSVSIAASANAICPGTQVVFTATPVNGGTAPIYQWTLNGANAGTNSDTYSNSTLNNGDVVTCILRSNVTCVTTATATSNSLTMSVNTPVTPAISISSSATKICAGTVVNFTAAAVNGGTTPVYQWKLNGVNTGTNSNAYSNTALNNGDIVYCTLLSSIGCTTSHSATSDSIVMTVNPVIVPAVTIAASATAVCNGTPVSFAASAVNCGSSPQYDWKLNGNSTGINNADYTNLTVHNGDTVSCTVTAQVPGCYLTPNANSNVIAITVNDIPVVSAGKDTTVFKGTSFLLNGSASGTIVAYQWVPVTYLSNSNLPRPLITPLTTTTYTLTATSVADCQASADVTVTVLSQIVIPNAFSPNGDGINDTWQIQGLKDYQGAVINVFDRYGQMVFRATTYKDWDGTYNGKPLPKGTYYYIINPQNKLPLLSGWVVILR
jgi:gliding motility-associated-like protein